MIHSEPMFLQSKNSNYSTESDILYLLDVTAQTIKLQLRQKLGLM